MNAHVQLRTPTQTSDLLALTKPGIVTMTVLTAAGGVGLSSERIGSFRTVAALVGTALCVASANVFNMYLERESDRWMPRTANRPLPQGRVPPHVALTFGAVIGIAAIALLSWLVRPMTAALGVFGFFVYVFMYTPLKKLTPHALLVGCVAGAVPPLMGWSAATGSIHMGGLSLALVLFVWQIPHFLAIASFRREEYERAEILAASVVWGTRTVRLLTVASSAGLVVAGLVPVAAGIAGVWFGVVAAAAGLWMLANAMRTDGGAIEVWARRVFRASLVYMPVVALGTIVDVITK